MLVLGLDLETSGLDKETCDVLEVGAVLWNVEEKRPVKLLSFFNKDFKGEIPEFIENLVGLKSDEVKKWGRPIKEGLEELNEMFEAATYVVAHNGNGFDEPFLRKTYNDQGMQMPKKIWIDTLTDLPYPDGMGTRKLGYLACEHGFINPFPHRALTDVLTTLKIFSSYDFGIVEEVAKSPMVQVIAHVGYEERDKPRRAGFRWDSKKRHWFMDIRKALIPAREFNFKHHIDEGV